MQATGSQQIVSPIGLEYYLIEGVYTRGTGYNDQSTFQIFPKDTENGKALEITAITKDIFKGMDSDQRKDKVMKYYRGQALAYMTADHNTVFLETVMWKGIAEEVKGVIIEGHFFAVEFKPMPTDNWQSYHYYLEENIGMKWDHYTSKPRPFDSYKKNLSSVKGYEVPIEFQKKKEDKGCIIS
ncbi:hypothetical protein [Candidatus Protochlamydia phocaeensis]|uniref:hypothetical protein n=1 Tax=Candidatus Protochlamydia phocaeensis TaxID=1414722 RepID=UPI000837C449|nr:hypothetical protein [Candidatus Protochlamydia phocaeensis]